jgi:hypothetical protein
VPAPFRWVAQVGVASALSADLLRPILSPPNGVLAFRSRQAFCYQEEPV